jgi:hypothetical protein
LLLENVTQNTKYNRYVVAYGLYQDRTAWQHGNYFDDLEEAEVYFESKKEL